MRSGTLRHRIIIQGSTEVEDGMGGFATVWADKLEMWVAIWPLTAKERLDAMKLELQLTHKIRGRYRSEIMAKDRIKFGTRIFNIVSLINKDERNVQLDMLALEDI